MLITVGGKRLRVFGPWRDDGGRIRALSERRMREWARGLGARLLTPAERDALHVQADVRVRFKARNPVTAPFDAMHEDIEDALDGRDHDSVLVSAGKTNVEDGSGHATNYGGYVPRSEVRWSKKRGCLVWDVPGGGNKVYPTTSPDFFVIQQPGHAHGTTYHDYSHLGYCGKDMPAADIVADVTPIADTDPAPPPSGPRTLRRTLPPMVGDDVAELQRALSITADGVFGSATEAAVKGFQRGVGLHDDGVVGPLTREALERPKDDGGDYPPRPDFEPLYGNAERGRVFGRFAYVPAPTTGNPEAIRITDDWPARRLVQLNVPQLARIPGIIHNGRRVGQGPRNGLVTCHHLVADQMRALWKAWDEAGLLDRVLTWEGMWSPRFIRRSRVTLSNHAFATAFDINAPWNGYGRTPAPKGAKGSVVELVALANAHGLYWGGHFRRTVDGMHYEFVVQ